MTNSALELDRNKTAMPQPVAGALATQPVGTAVGAAARGAAAGASACTVAGAVAGGKEIAMSIDPAAGEAYWREDYASRPYL